LSFSFRDSNLITAIIPIISSIFIYFILSYLLIPSKITIPLSIIMSTLIFGLTRYYSTPLNGYVPQSTTSNIIYDSENKKSIDKGNGNYESQYSLVLIITYGILLAVCALFSKPDSNIFVNWNEIGPIGIAQLVAAIMLTFFLPGYAIVQIISKKNSMNPVLKVLLAYLLSILISGGIEYISAMYLDHSISDTK
jgi:hypothetical protein